MSGSTEGQSSQDMLVVTGSTGNVELVVVQSSHVNGVVVDEATGSTGAEEVDVEVVVQSSQVNGVVVEEAMGSTGAEALVVDVQSNHW